MSDSVDLDNLWREFVDTADAATKAWLNRTKPIAMHGTTMMLAVSDQRTRDRIETRLRNQIEQYLSASFDRPTHLAVMISPEQVPLPEPEPVQPSLIVDERYNEPATRTKAATETKLNPRYTFESFVAGSSNRFAHAAAAAVAETPGKAYNPLLIYGASGLGKTHLLHAIGHYVQSYYEKLRVKYVSTEELTNDFINAISSNRTAEFRSAYREVDVLLIDDIQFLASKIQTQEEFFHTFNTLHNAQKQIVMTSDRPPKLLEALEPRLRSRFEWGLLTDIQPPDLETRIAILRKKVASQRLTAGTQVLEMIAARITSNIRELEGALTRVAALASLNREEITLELANQVMEDLIPEGEVRVDVVTIIKATSDYFGIAIDELTGPSRVASIAMPRHIAIYLCRELTDLSLPKIGSAFGGRDHSTVLNSVRRISDRIGEDRALYTQVTELTNKIKQA
ncbi:chromosomal replication initiator protein DnaA [Tessaracoccus sp. OH4464_COT-324]|uniref:chromosomal replication initiator protein DnaA n=1 Tax=Tessaracoccus sp. OH4464_COT-324 TaxID=2491059 RepID=UPI000F6441E0|nr:chromosomal replication initiator protein DnaA [Tessaracoccus sp. OH4464_COT-324]RRD46128.1 chromosomal replication initiator protein DnaA [Tessaracoccus sp. OH4464_COT-324]